VTGLSLPSGPAADRGLRRAVRAVLRTPLGAVALVVLMVVALCAAFAPWLAPYPPDLIHGGIPAPPSAAFVLGADEIGRDILSRLIHGARVSVQVALASVAIALVVGSTIGVLAGWYGGWIGDVAMRVMDAMIAFPMLVLALSIIAWLGPGVENAILAIAIVNVPKYARLVRGETLAVREREFVRAARALGMGDAHLIAIHLWPNVSSSVIVFSSLAASQALITESALSFLGLGVQPPDPSWGAMIAAGMTYWSDWWIAFFPGLAIFLTVLSLNVFGDALRDVLDPRIGT
jgi:peptide/nickel transport system permease protein